MPTSQFSLACTVLDKLKEQQKSALPELYNLFENLSDFFNNLKLEANETPLDNIGIMKNKTDYKGDNRKEWLL